MRKIMVADDNKRFMKSAAIISMLGMFGGFGRTFRGMPRLIKPKAKLFSVLSITPGKHHAWCDSDCGRIRKPIGSIPRDLMNEYRNSHTMV